MAASAAPGTQTEDEAFAPARQSCRELRYLVDAVRAERRSAGLTTSGTVPVSDEAQAAEARRAGVPVDAAVAKRQAAGRMLDLDSADATLAHCEALAAGRVPPTPSGTPYPFSDCGGLEPGDVLEFQTLQCDPDAIAMHTMDCRAGTYVHLTRPGQEDLEGITGLTATWRKAEPVDARYSRTQWAFQNCKESG